MVCPERCCPGDPQSTAVAAWEARAVEVKRMALCRQIPAAGLSPVSLLHMELSGYGLGDDDAHCGGGAGMIGAWGLG
ncbi:hypothetical protein NDU88_004793 [Pleurodeles waltl]|uniref:Uncharacterized protein n=1 Tax=Pleurodeles waltl TaxID=8319 RepID=A0AAV7LJR9_PLEWA|nr:hypothetical protein NDU88_004793 [Pleurodeles waltl]